VKEEVRAGRSVSTAITTGYPQGPDGDHRREHRHVPRRFILFIIATAGVQGFAFTLGIGVIVSLFTAVLATQAILYSLRGTRLIRSKAALGAGEQRFKFKIDYMGKAKYFFSLSGLHPARVRAGDVRQGHQLRHRLRGRHAHHASLEKPATVEQVRNSSRRWARRREDPDADEPGSSAATGVQIFEEGPRPDRVKEANARMENAFGGRGRRQRGTRSARASARRSRAPRSTRSSPR
jgi:SecD/SecF fusion protein